jgi:predicted AAA+ superfamily ATPase
LPPRFGSSPVFIRPLCPFSCNNAATSPSVFLDEIQKIPPLLDEVHRLMESRRWRFALCGSSARKLRRGGANQLAGRALTLSMESFSAAELGKGFDVDTYFSVLSDTLVGHILPAWRPGLKVREAAQPKFYWFDPGVARAAAGLLRDPADRAWQGAALETLVYHELRVYNETSPKQRPLSYYRTPAGVEVDFIVQTAGRRPGSLPRVAAIEVKRSERWGRSWEKPLRSLSQAAGVKVERMIGIYCGSRRYDFEGLRVLPVAEFVQALHAGEVF